MKIPIKITPLEKVEIHPWGKFRLFLKREDLLKPAGGNKVRRFDAFFEKMDHISTVMTLSNPGSHSFHVLKEYLTSDKNKAGCDALYLLERDIPLSPYHKSRRQDYLLNPQIKVIQGNLLKLLWKQNNLKNKKVSKIGIGGHINIQPNPYILVMAQCVSQLKDLSILKNLQHYFPIASGNMADGFLEYLYQWKIESQDLYGIMTGALPSRWMLRFKYLKQIKMNLIRPISIDYEQYKELATEFHNVTGIWLDPTHTIQFMKILQNSRNLKGNNIVLWMTQPFLSKLIL